MAISGLIFSYFNIFLTTYWPVKPVDHELKPVGTAGFKGLGKTLMSLPFMLPNKVRLFYSMVLLVSSQCLHSLGGLVFTSFVGYQLGSLLNLPKDRIRKV